MIDTKKVIPFVWQALILAALAFSIYRGIGLEGFAYGVMAALALAGLVYTLRADKS